jgi:phospho-N-acetylmuramoyl-pentapeptide-transferase
VKSILLAATLSLIISLLGTPFAIRVFRRRGIGQLLREDFAELGGGLHEQKRGTPTMGGVVIIAAVALAYFITHLVTRRLGEAGAIVVAAMIGMGFVGFLDDYLKIRKQRSLGLNKTWKTVGQLLVALGIGLAVKGLPEASTSLSFVRETALDLGPFFLIWVFVMMSASTNGVNLTDGLDGLAAGSSAMVFLGYLFIAFWQSRHLCDVLAAGPGCYVNIPDPLDLAVVAAAGLGACAGFLWWNAAPAQIFMGDTGSLALGGAFAALAILTSTQLLLVLMGGLFVLEVTSVIIQIISFRGFKRRVFRMAPIHHHFELGGWPEITVIVRFWIIAGLSTAFALGVFYADFLAKGGAQ